MMLKIRQIYFNLPALLCLAALLGSAIGIAPTPASASGARPYECRLDKWGKGPRHCQCHMLRHRLASEKILRYLADQDVCRPLAKRGGGGSSVRTNEETQSSNDGCQQHGGNGDNNARGSGDES